MQQGELAAASPQAGRTMRLLTRRLEERDLPSLFRIYEDSFGAKPLARFKQRWRWQFKDNPACKQEDAACQVAEIDGEIAAHLGAFPVRMKIMDREMIVQFECDFAVDQKLRHRNPVWALQFAREALAKNGTPLKGGTDYTPEHRRMREWLKHKPVRISALCSRPVNAGARLRFMASRGEAPAFLAQPPASWAAEAGIACVIAANNAPHPLSADPSVAIRRVERAGDAFDDLWARLRRHFPITSVRDQAFVRWRFFEDPSFENILLGAYSDAGELLGYIVVRSGLEDNGCLTGRILDLFCDPDDARVASSLVAAGVRQLAKLGVISATCRGMHPSLRRYVRQALYRPAQARYDAEAPALILWTGAPELAEAVYDETNWHFTLADGSGGFSP